MPLEFPDRDEEFDVEGTAAYLASQVPLHPGRDVVLAILDQLRAIVELNLQNYKRRHAAND